jgi:Flp pilus assembly protein TadG
MRRAAGRRRGAAKRRGASVVEFAVIAPIFFLIVLGIIEMGRAVMVSQVLVNASREGARKACLTSMTVAEVQTWVDEYLQTVGFPAGAATVTISNQTTEGGDFSTTSDLSAVESGMGVEVRVDITFADVSWLPPSAYMPAVLEGVTIMRKE